MTNLRKTAVRGTMLSGLAVALAGCGSGNTDGGGIGGGPETTSFPGITQSAAFAGVFPSPLELSPAGSPQAGTLSFIRDNGEVIAVEVSTGGRTVTFDVREGDIDQSVGPVLGFISADGQDLILITDAEATPLFAHQSFGTWATGVASGSGTVSAGSFGDRTAAGDLVALSDATYVGVAAGFVEQNGRIWPTTAEAEVRVENAFRDVTFSTSRTTRINTSGGADQIDPSLDLSGTGTVAGAGFTANVTATGISGNATGVFYGPNAAEVGGTFAASGNGPFETSPSGTTSYVGAFGAAR